MSDETLMEFVAASVAPYKRLRAVELIDALPRSLAGKLLRRVLVERERARTPALHALAHGAAQASAPEQRLVAATVKES